MSRRQGWSAVVLLAIGAVLVAGCASGPALKEEAVSKSLAPMPQPERTIGFRVIRLQDGKEYVSSLVALTAETETWQDSLGCRLVLPRTGFAPALEFTNCEGNTGTQSVTLTRGAPYPLALGNKWVYAYSGSNARGDRWTGQRYCEVEGTAKVTVGLAEHDTYKVVCEDNSGNTKITRTYYMSPALQTFVVQERYRVRNWVGAPPPDRTRWEFVSQEAGAVSRGDPTAPAPSR